MPGVTAADLGSVPESSLRVRLEALRRAQNPDGGWGYLPAKQSWLEPTCYAALALHGEAAADRAWALVRSWQGSDGSVRPAADVAVSSWGAALLVSLAVTRNEYGDPFHRGVSWLLGTAGVESRLINRAAARLGLLDAERDLSLKGWPWKPDTASWVEPTAHALVALKKASVKGPGGGVEQRVSLGEAQLLDVRCRDGGWNYGSRAALKVDLPSYPETTALALVGLQGRDGLGASLDLASRMLRDTRSTLAQAWLTIALRLHDAAVPTIRPAAPSPDLQILALEALAAPEGNYRFLKTGASA
jgi:hypothetical protein